MNRRDQIRMTPDEAAAFIDEQRVVICATTGARGWPHLMPLWFIVREDQIWAWTYAKSQKVRNLERDDRATLQVESGVQYHELRGVMIEARVRIHRELETVATVGSELAQRMSANTEDTLLTEAIRAQAAKRVALQFVPERTVTWDHRKLGGQH